jgi:hypothetical protein
LYGFFKKIKDLFGDYGANLELGVTIARKVLPFCHMNAKVCISKQLSKGKFTFDPMA